MTEFEQKLLMEFQNLRAEIAALRSDYSILRSTYFDNLSQDSIVGTDFISYKFNISEEAARRGRFGTNAIPRVREKPLGFLKRDVLAVFREQTKLPAEKAAEIRYKAKNIRRIKTYGK